MGIGLEIQNGSCTPHQIDEEQQNEHVLEVTINELTQIIVGYNTIEHLFEHKTQHIPPEWLPENLFPPVPCSLNVWF